ncbi:hypothetical protein ABVK25_009604 [Lepraria finkii]|uniref:Rhodopsin domain-containing protein n=1 Tax=Lepraria finkii TaxID=1340010 RepID=A0ABR4AZI3_9LECA
MAKLQQTFTKQQYFSIIWALSGIALAFLVTRLIIRLKLYGRLLVDDGLVCLAITCLLVSVITNTVFASRTYVVENVQINHASKPHDYEKIADSYAKYQWADAYLFFTGIWAVKGSFLAFYDGLTNRLTYYRRAWWATIVITILTYIGCLFAYAFLAGPKFKTSLKNEAIKYQFSADVSTDVLITLIPLTLAWKSQIPTRQKLALMGIFSLSLIITIFSIVRFILNSPQLGTAGPSWLQAWSTIEQAVSVSVACLASFRLFVIDRKRKSKRSSSRPSPKNTAHATRFPVDKVSFSHHRPQGEHSLREQRSQRSMEIELLEPHSARNAT